MKNMIHENAINGVLRCIHVATVINSCQWAKTGEFLTFQKESASLWWSRTLVRAGVTRGKHWQDRVLLRWMTLLYYRDVSCKDCFKISSTVVWSALPWPWQNGAVIICLCLCDVPPTPNRLPKFFTHTWPHPKGSAGEIIIRHKSTRSRSVCKY